ncbi:MAG: SNF2-related protein [Kribbellaceae bacterium]
MRREVLVDIDATDLDVEVGSGSYERGRAYARRGAVLNVMWDPAASTLHGKVVGHGAIYQTSAIMNSDDGGPYQFEQGECSCPVAVDCKHVVALVLTAAGEGKSGTSRYAARVSTSHQPARQQPPAEPPASWEQSLRSLLNSVPGDADEDRRTPLAIELSINAPQQGRYTASAARLQARLVRPGKTGGWVNGGLAWSALDSVGYGFRGELLRTDHVRVLQEMYAVSGASAVRSPYYYGSREAKMLDLATFDSTQLWPLLDQAQAMGVRLVHARNGLGDVPRTGPVELCLDVTGSDSLTVRPLLREEGTTIDAAPVAFVGATGHGVVYVERTELADRPQDWSLRLARLSRPVPAELRRLALEQEQLEIPAAGRARFAGDFYPRLRHLAAVTSSDESFSPPQISAPTLVLTASYGAEHELTLDWDWSYDVDATPVRLPLYGSAQTGIRDVEAEQEVVARLAEDLPVAAYGIWAPGSSRPLAAQARLTGLETMRFSTEVLPLLTGRPGIRVEIGGEPPDYREAGDTLRIGLSVDTSTDGAERTDWFDLGMTITVEGREVPFAAVFLALNQGESHLLLSDGAYFSLEKPELQALRRLIDEARALQDKPDDPLRISRFQAGFFSELAELGVVDRQAREWQRQVGGLLAPSAVDAIPAPAGLSATLRPYQADGLGWLAFLWQHRLGGILADDMGLGKTIQALALICQARTGEPGAAPFLIVAPTSVVANWHSEAARFTPGLSVAAVSDTLRKRGESLDQVVAGADVVVTSYTLFRLDFEEYGAREWSGLLLDEAQFVKNHQSKAYQCARRLPASFKLAITGTPMENNLMELWSLLSITAPGLFPNPARFRDYYARAIEKGDSDLLAQLRRRIKPLMRRRTKEQVAADLPAKQEQVLEVELHPRHRKVYERQLQRVRQEVLGLVDDLDRNRFAILRSLTLLRQLSLHAGLVDETHRELPSAKVDVLLEQLDDVIAGGHRALVFSQFTGFLHVVRRRLDTAGVEYCYLDGKTRRRAAVVDSFKSGAAPVFLISLKAGGFGLNLTEADYCFLLDPWWNPATEAQAVDRTHRIGQTRNVMVYRLIAGDTIEEKVMALKDRKAALFSSLMDDGNAFGSTLDANDIRELFS